MERPGELSGVRLPARNTNRRRLYHGGSIGEGGRGLGSQQYSRARRVLRRKWNKRTRKTLVALRQGLTDRTSDSTHWFGLALEKCEMDNLGRA